MYKITNIINNKCYIGSSIDTVHRWNAHCYDLRGKRHGNKHLQHAWDKYGSVAFVFEILEECEAIKETLLAREQHYIDTLKPEYNIMPMAGSRLGSKHSIETKTKMSRPSPRKGMRSLEAIAKREAYLATHPRKGSPECNEKLRQAHKGIPLSDEHKANLKGRTPWNKGKTGLLVHTVEAKAKIAKAGTGRTRTPESIAKFQEKRLGHIVSPETRAKLSDANCGKPSPNKGKTASLETREKLRIAHLGQIPANKGKSATDETKAKLRAAWTRRKAVL